MNLLNNVHVVNKQNRLLVKPGTAEHRSTGTPEHRNSKIPEHRNTGTAKILNLVQILKSLAGGGGGEFILRIISSQVNRRKWTRVDPSDTDIESSQKGICINILIPFVYALNYKPSKILYSKNKLYIPTYFIKCF